MNGSIEDFRKFYAKFIVASAGANDDRLIDAFSTVPREKFLGGGPWPVSTASGYLPTISDDPRLLYQDIVIGLLPEKGINNGQPGLHARCIAELAPKPGEFAIHIGAGTGYYTAVLAELVGPSGGVDAYEIETGLAERAKAYLEGYENVHVHAGSASDAMLPSANIIYVNAGVTRPDDRWIDALKVGGRIAVPITPNEGFGGMLMITRAAADAYAARILCRVGFVSCAGNRSDTESVALAKAFEPHSFRPVKSFHRFTLPDETAWFVGNDWWLSMAEPVLTD
jgi:protein-L-isoaspartate(D-aspartate) O-methyltransferase